VGDAALIATWGTLQDFDEQFSIEELEGLPKHFWFLLRGGPDAARCNPTSSNAP
jgi:hypothetical protein